MRYKEIMTQLEFNHKNISIVILAAGLGTRMGGNLPKAAIPLADKPMLGHILSMLCGLELKDVTVVIGPDMPILEKIITKELPKAKTVLQTDRLGTAHAVQQALPLLDQQHSGAVVVLYGDSPFIDAPTLHALTKPILEEEAALVVAGFEIENPQGYGRLILGKDGELKAIIEQAETTDEINAIQTCNSGVMAFDRTKIGELIHKIDNNNQKQEYYLTDAVQLANQQGFKTKFIMQDYTILQGIDHPTALAQAEAQWQQQKRADLLKNGVRMIAPDTVYFSAETNIEAGAVIEPYCVFSGSVTIHKGATIRAFSHLEGCEIHQGATIGPYARLRPGVTVGQDAKIGNFVEAKNTHLAAGAKANHLTYLGDAHIGKNANIGAGTITCNYDGTNKHPTKIGENVFVGSNSALVAPVTINDSAMIAAGSTITGEIEKDALAITRAEQKIKSGAANRFHQKNKQK